MNHYLGLVLVKHLHLQIAQYLLEYSKNGG